MNLDKKRVQWLKGNLVGQDLDQCILISAPGRTEVGGNHTDHQKGNVLAAAINLDVLMLANPNDKFTIRLQTKEFGEQTVDFGAHFGVSTSVTGLYPNNADSQTEKLIRGVVAFLDQEGYKVGGFNASSTSQVLIGSGLSSSAAFENAVAQTINYLYNDGQIPLTVIARAGQFAENIYLGKGSGLMDQSASAFGGFVQINFADTKNPVINRVDFDFEKSGYALCITDTKGSHVGLDAAYSTMPDEMKAVASFFGCEVLSEVSEVDFWDKIADLRIATCDRAVLRAGHFFADTKRAVLEAKALESGKFEQFLELVRDSGKSSLAYLQNVWNTADDQGVTLGLLLSEHVLQPAGNQPIGAWRVHGGGLAGTIQAFVPLDLVAEYQRILDATFGAGSCQVLNIRAEGATKVDSSDWM